ncbi:MAG: hypothetical protein LJE94_16965 [Deltaproteobacteria bacterium]|nr:hypothetical protein [Deltaproteobacteria bacterium]
METIAVYWEETIRTYGFQVEKGLCLVRADVDPTQLPDLGRWLGELGKAALRFRLVLVHQPEAGALRLHLVCSGEWKDRLTTSPSPVFTDDARHYRVDYPVEMLTFYGPHFGDRYGIAHKACDALEKEDIRYIATGCSAASVHFVFPENRADRAADALGTVFKTP